MDAHPKRPAFVVLEGLDGAGTTTQAALLAEALRARGPDVCLTAEPTTGPLGLVARAYVRGELTLDPRTAALAFTADRSDHLTRTIRPALAEARPVVCDRYLLSTLAYQGADGVSREWILEVSAGFDIPDLTVFLDVPGEVRGARISRRTSTDRYERPDVQDALRPSYLSSIDLLRSRGHRITVLDGAEDPQDVLRGVLGEVDTLP